MICVDASLAAKWILLEDYSQQARGLYRACIQADERMVAPPLLASEMTNILRQRMRRGQPRLSLSDAAQLLQHFLSMPVALVAPPRLHETALAVADRHNLAAAYDAHYVALAQMSGCNLWTADERLLNVAGATLPFVKLIGGYTDGDPL